VVSGENLPNKPAPDLYLAAIETASVVPWDAVVLEDSELGVASAVRAGARAVAVPSETTRGQDFSRAHVRVDSLDQLIPFL
jgi:beta-phosphoglucomutase-like phosphatase (HAD superfamily)